MQADGRAFVAQVGGADQRRTAGDPQLVGEALEPLPVAGDEHEAVSGARQFEGDRLADAAAAAGDDRDFGWGGHAWRQSWRTHASGRNRWIVREQRT